MPRTGIIHMTGGTDPRKCPTAEGEKCNCGGELEPEYGCCCYGVGSFMRCQTCYTVFNFHDC